MISGNKINYQVFEERISEVEIMLSNTSVKDFTIKMLTYSEDINRFRNLSDDEEIFMLPANLPILTGVNFSFFKWKPVEKITFCLQTLEENENLVLLSSNFKKLIKFAKINSSISEGNEHIKRIKCLENYNSNCIIEINVKFPEENIVVKRVNTEKITQPVLD